MYVCTWSSILEIMHNIIKDCTNFLPGSQAIYTNNETHLVNYADSHVHISDLCSSDLCSSDQSSGDLCSSDLCSSTDVRTLLSIIFLRTRILSVQYHLLCKFSVQCICAYKSNMYTSSFTLILLHGLSFRSHFLFQELSLGISQLEWGSLMPTF